MLIAVVGCPLGYCVGNGPGCALLLKAMPVALFHQTDLGGGSLILGPWTACNSLVFFLCRYIMYAATAATAPRVITVRGLRNDALSSWKRCSPSAGFGVTGGVLSCVGVSSSCGVECWQPMSVVLMSCVVSVDWCCLFLGCCL